MNIPNTSILFRAYIDKIKGHQTKHVVNKLVYHTPRKILCFGGHPPAIHLGEKTLLSVRVRTFIGTALINHEFRYLFGEFSVHNLAFLTESMLRQGIVLGLRGRAHLVPL